jgi:hypothetical protein
MIRGQRGTGKQRSHLPRDRSLSEQGNATLLIQDHDGSGWTADLFQPRGCDRGQRPVGDKEDAPRMNVLPKRPD